MNLLRKDETDHNILYHNTHPQIENAIVVILLHSKRVIFDASVIQEQNRRKEKYDDLL
jgi:hypothetical protein